VCVGVAYFRVADAAKSVVAIENAGGAINQIAPTTHEPRRRRQADAKREKKAWRLLRQRHGRSLGS
jgi:hypothetical protein